VFLVQVTGIAEKPLYGVANVGNRPTVNNVKARLEVHLLDFDGECYGRQVTVWFLQKIRDEQKFDSKEQLKQQIAQDIAQAKQWLTQ
jgi:riboflavin kinase/FMN adenylyltransferase